jgi:hypothetical protein
MQAAADLLEAWLHQFRGYESLDARLVLERVRDFLESEQHRFQPVGPSRDDSPSAARPSRNLAGYLLHEGGREHHYVRASVFSKEILRGLDRPTALRVLLGAGILLANPQTAEPFQSMRLPLGTSPAQRVYHLVNALQDEARRSPGPPCPAPEVAWG